MKPAKLATASKKKITTDFQVQGLKCGADGKARDYVVSTIPGLRIRAMKNGTKTWSLIYTPANGSKKRMPLGEYPNMSLQKAGIEAQIIRAAIFKGEDPMASKKEARVEAAARATATAYTFAKLANDYIEQHAKLKARSWRAMHKRLRYILPTIGDIPADKVTKFQCLQVLNDVASQRRGEKVGFAQGSRGMANCIQTLMRTIFNFGIREGLIPGRDGMRPINPAGDITPRGEEEARTRVLTFDEMRQFWSFPYDPAKIIRAKPGKKPFGLYQDPGQDGPEPILTPISKEDAIARGLGRYFTGQPCARGHISERYTSKPFWCIQCRAEDYKRKNAERTDRLNLPKLGVLTADIVRDVMRLELLIGQRVSEICGAEECEFDWDRRLWTIPGRRTKNKQEHAVPLPEMAAWIFKEAFKRSRSPDYAFCINRFTSEKIAPVRAVTILNVWWRIRADMGLADINTHDLRRTLSTQAGEMGFPDFDIDLVTNHISGRSQVNRKHYNHSKYLEPKLKLLKAWEARLSTILEGRNPDEKALEGKVIRPVFGQRGAA